MKDVWSLRSDPVSIKPTISNLKQVMFYLHYSKRSIIKQHGIHKLNKDSSMTVNHSCVAEAAAGASP